MTDIAQLKKLEEQLETNKKTPEELQKLKTSELLLLHAALGTDLAQFRAQFEVGDTSFLDEMQEEAPDLFKRFMGLIEAQTAQYNVVAAEVDRRFPWPKGWDVAV